MSSKQKDEKTKKKSSFFKTISKLSNFGKKKKIASNAPKEDVSEEDSSYSPKHYGEFSNTFNHDHEKEEEFSDSSFNHDHVKEEEFSNTFNNHVKEDEFSNTFNHHVMIRNDSPLRSSIIEASQYHGERGEEFLKATYYFNDHYSEGCSIM
ncbi:hypothetical protein LR48_Vigan11g162700 [Vigna angularis]|uniref:Uncharacterized protein n=1 Tax=Phaseolus angularis TaxID=3914 RepID=A0A0L9VUI8_PHAAN|nr:uncharacterized protein HKW66_Vig0204910 [Vigna angularis]KOM58593.1 hypothetical protein LR48_Vigan11g162700 [Vigna angularis]